MDLSLTPEQEQLRAAAAEFARSYAPSLDMRADDHGTAGHADRWRLMGELGWFSLTIPEDRGGACATPFDVAALLEGLGTRPMPGPLFETAVLLPHLLAALDWLSDDDLVERLIGGSMSVAVALPSLARLPATVAHSNLSLRDGRLSGEVYPVREAGDATHYLVAAAAEEALTGHALLLVPADRPRLARDLLPGFANRQYRLTFDSVPIDDAPVARLTGDHLRRLGDATLRSIPALCAFQVGSLQQTLNMTVGYSKQRIQFGRTIGSFQRVQDHVIDLLNGLDAARWTTYFALAGQSPGSTDRRAVHVAKTVTSRAHFTCCDSAHEVHAGIGCDVDYGLVAHTYLSRVMYAYLGAPAWHRRQLVNALSIFEPAQNPADRDPTLPARPAPPIQR